MRQLRSIPLALVLFSLSLSCAPKVNEEQQAFDSLASRFVSWYIADDPVRATGLGVHDWDEQWPEVTAGDIERRRVELTGWLDELTPIARESLEGDAYFDHRVLEYGIRADLLEWEEVRSWRRNPSFYNRIAARGLSALVDREFAPLDRRVDSLIRRLETIDMIYAAAEANLDDVPRLWADLSARSIRGTMTFLERDLPAALEAQGLAELPQEQRDRLATAIAAASERIEQHRSWLVDELTPRATGDFRLGAELYRKKLLYEEHFDFDIETLKQMNDEAIRNYREWVAREAARVDENESAEQVMDRITSSFPANDQVIPTARRYVDDAKRLILEKEIVTLPADTLPVIRPTPEFARSGFASMSTPGPFETVATEAYYNITLVDESWDERQQAEHLTYFNYPGLLGISVHEVMPGHYVQLLYQQQVPTDLRKLFMPGTLVEGWAHYAEQMMVDEGLGGDVPSVRLGQLRRALQRHARWQAALALHIDGLSTLDAAIQFAETAYFADFPALRETQRGSYDPTYLVYALGRMEILRLREDYRAAVEARGESFSLRRFHDELLRLGLPLPLAREALIDRR